MKLDPFNRKDPLAEAAKSVLVNEDVVKIKKRVAQLKVGDKTNYGTVKEIGPDSITFKALHTPKTEIAFRQRKIGKPDYILMSLVKFTDDGKKVDKTFKEAVELEEKKVTESNEFVGAAAAAKVAGEDEFEFEGETFPTTIGLAVAKKIMGENNEVLESNEFVGAAAAAKVAGEDEFEFEGETFPTTIGLAVAKKIMGESFSIKEAKSSTGYELYHKDFSSAMAHAYEFAKKKYRIEVDPKSIDDEVATGPKKPSKGETNSYRLLGKDGKKAFHVQVHGMDSGKYELNMYKEDVEYAESIEDLEEADGEWFTAEMHVKSSGQLYSTFWVQAKNMSDAKKKADKVFKELMKTSYPKDWSTYSKKFTLKVVKGDNIDELMP